MFGLFKTVTIDDPVLGPLARRGGGWIGTIALPGCDPVELCLDGDRKTPYPGVLAAAHALPERLASLRPAIADALLDHLEPYQDAMQDPVEQKFFIKHIPDPEERNRIIAISTPQEAWADSAITGVEIGRELNTVRVLIKIGTEWDIEHTLGAYFDDWEFVELNGSV